MENQELLEKIKSIIKENYSCGKLGLYFCSGSPYDSKSILYNNNGVVVKICYYYEYFEVFGLTNNQAKELLEFYNNLEEERKIK